MAVILVAKINYTTSGHLETHLFTRDKHTRTKHPAITNMRFHFIFYALQDAVFSFSPETVILVTSFKFLVVLNASGRVI